MEMRRAKGAGLWNGKAFKVIILAAGMSRRFGRNKLLTGFNGRPLADWTFKAVEAAGCEPGAVTVVWHDPSVAVLSEAYGYNTCYNAAPEEGQSASVRLGIDASGAAGAYLFLTADQPLLSGQTIAGMLSAFPLGKGKIMMASWQGKVGNPVIFDARFKSELLGLTGDTGGRRIIKLHPEAAVQYEVGFAEELMDVDHVEDLEHLSDILSSHSDL